MQRRSAAIAATLALALTFFLGTAHAQRRLIPVAELIEVPVSLSTAKPLTAQQVRAAIVSAALTAQWDADPIGDGKLKLVVLRDFDNRVELLATFTATSYTLKYVSSANLAFQNSLEDRIPSNVNANRSAGVNSTWADDFRKTRAAVQPEFKYAVDLPGVQIHPTYEQWLYELAAGIRRHLRQIQ